MQRTARAGFGAHELRPPARTPSPAGTPDGPITFCGLVADSRDPRQRRPAPTSSPGFTSSNREPLGLRAAGTSTSTARRRRSAIGGGAATAFVGDLLNFSRERDRRAAPARTAQYSWTWGDNTAERQRRQREPHVHAGRHVPGDAGDGRHRRQPAAPRRRPCVVSASRRARRRRAAARRRRRPGPPAAAPRPAAAGRSRRRRARRTSPSRSAASSGAAGATPDDVRRRASTSSTAKKVKITPKLKALPMALTADDAGQGAVRARARGPRSPAQAGITHHEARDARLQAQAAEEAQGGRYSLRDHVHAGRARRRRRRKTIKITFTGARRRPSASSGAEPPSSARAAGSRRRGDPGRRRCVGDRVRDAPVIFSLACADTAVRPLPAARSTPRRTPWPSSPASSSARWPPSPAAAAASAAPPRRRSPARA